MDYTESTEAVNTVGGRVSFSRIQLDFFPEKLFSSSSSLRRISLYGCTITHKVVRMKRQTKQQKPTIMKAIHG